MSALICHEKLYHGLARGFAPKGEPEAEPEAETEAETEPKAEAEGLSGGSALSQAATFARDDETTDEATAEASAELTEPGVEAEVARRTEARRAKGPDGVHDLLRMVGDLTTAEALERGATPSDLAFLDEHRRAIRVRIAGEERWLAIEDAGRVRDALGAALPVGVPESFTEPVRDPLGDLVSRYARTHGPFLTADVAARGRHERPGGRRDRGEGACRPLSNGRTLSRTQRRPPLPQNRQRNR